MPRRIGCAMRNAMSAARRVAIPAPATTSAACRPRPANIKDSRRGHIRAFDVMPSGVLAKQSDRVFADLSGSEPGVPDGMKVDVEGNVYCGGAGGIWIMDRNGKKLGRLFHGAPAPTNIAFGG